MNSDADEGKKMLAAFGELVHQNECRKHSEHHNDKMPFHEKFVFVFGILFFYEFNNINYKTNAHYDKQN